MAVTEFNWTLHPEAEALVDDLIASALTQSPELSALDQALQSMTSTRLVNWLDHICGPVPTEELLQAGFVEGYRTRPGVWRHPGAQLPAIVISDRHIMALRVDDAAVFGQAQSPTTRISGSPKSGLRTATVVETDDVVILGLERRSWGQGIEPQTFDDAQTLASVEAWRTWAERDRPNATGEAAVASVVPTAQHMVDLVGVDLAASYVLEIERQYWQRRNTAAVLQHARQDRLGLGWGNNDHHTFRSSRPGFMPLIRMFHVLGFESRERFYAGEQAGWGAQVLEHPGCGGVLFTDVDLEPHEVGMDFSMTALGESAKCGTVGVWCALHGESILSAGMHHLEGQFEFEQLRDDLAGLGIQQMKPFSDFPHLRQAFTQAERWPVPSDRLDQLLRAGHIDDAKATEFAQKGAAGSHLENLQRRSGFKGFNQHSVSTTMLATDPRRYDASAH